MDEVIPTAYWDAVIKSRDDKSRMSYWLPILLENNLPVPYSRQIQATKEEVENLFDVYDGATPKEVMQLVDRIVDAMVRMQTGLGLLVPPFFLRTDYTSAKHDWENSCYIKDSNPKTILRHILNIYEYAECHFMPFVDTWYIRDMLPVQHYGIFRNYGNMPLTREYRFFVNDNNIECWHPYWPDDSFEQGGVEWTTEYPWDGCAYHIKKSLEHLDHNESKEVFALARKAGLALGGYWSVDIMASDLGWHIIDCAEGLKSWHHHECPKNKWVDTTILLGGEQL